MRVSEDDLRRLLSARSGARAGCPSPEALADAAAGRLPEPEREAVSAHVAGCADCAEEARLVAPLLEWSETAAGPLQPSAQTAAVQGRWPRRWPLWVAAAAVLVLAVPLLRWRRPPEPVTTRTQAQPQIRALVPESAALPRQRAVLRWSDLGAGVRYTVTVLTMDLSALASADRLEQSQYTVPADALSRVPAGGEIVWSVEARWPDGRRLVSPTFVHRLD